MGTVTGVVVVVKDKAADAVTIAGAVVGVPSCCHCHLYGCTYGHREMVTGRGRGGIRDICSGRNGNWYTVPEMATGIRLQRWQLVYGCRDGNMDMVAEMATWTWLQQQACDL